MSHASNVVRALDSVCACVCVCVKERESVFLPWILLHSPGYPLRVSVSKHVCVQDLTPGSQGMNEDCERCVYKLLQWVKGNCQYTPTSHPVLDNARVVGWWLTGQGCGWMRTWSVSYLAEPDALCETPESSNVYFPMHVWLGTYILERLTEPQVWGGGSEWRTGRGYL